MEKNYDGSDLLDLYNKVNNQKQPQVKYNKNTNNTRKSTQTVRRTPAQDTIIKQNVKETNKSTKNTSKRKRSNKIKSANSNKQQYKAEKGTFKKILALGLAFISAGVVGAAVEEYNDHQEEKIIATVQDANNDPVLAKIDWSDRKKITSDKLEDGKYLEIADDSIVLVQEDKIRPGDKLNDVILYTEDGIVEGKVEGKHLEESKFQLTKEGIKEYQYIYKVLPDVGVNLRSSPNLVEDNTNRVMGIMGGEYVLGGVPEITTGNKFPWVKVAYVNEHGINEGYIREDLLERVDKDYEKQKNEQSLDGTIMQVDTKHHGGIDLNCRRAPEIKSNNILKKIPSGEFVYLTGEQKISEARNWVEITYENENGHTIKGWVDNSYLKDVIGKQMEVKIDSNEQSFLDIKLKPSQKSDSILKLENGFIINITQNDWNSKVEKNGEEWLKVNVDGKIGYVESKYLEEVIPMKEEQDHSIPKIESKELKELINKISLNKQGKVTGIDSMGITAAEIELLYNKGIVENQVSSKLFAQDVNISNVNGDINFMYFRIGASGYGKNFSIIDNTHYVEQVKKCEELGIPYGFYYYSTAINEQEAAKEFNHIEKSLDSLGELKYNLLPFAIDVELAANPKNDRQYGNDTTGAKAYLTNCIQNDLGIDVMLYTSGNCTLSTTKDANVLDLEKYGELTGVKDVWMPMVLNTSGNRMQAYQEYASKFPDSMNLIMQQEVLDMVSSGIQIDLNTISKNDLIRWLERALERIEGQRTAQTDQLQIDSDDYELE